MIRPLLTAVAASIVTIPCAAQAPARGSIRAQWDSLASQLPSDAQQAIAALESFRERRGLFFTLWADSTVDSTQYPLNDAPCGIVASALLTQLPLVTHPLSVELAVEVDSTGRELRRWPLPLDARISGVSGDLLFVPYRLWTGTESRIVGDLVLRASGAFHLVPAIPTEPSPEQVDCPPLKVFAGSAYTTCERFMDRKTKKRRLIAYQLPCT